MSKEINTIVKKTVKVACVTCIAAGAVALMTSAAAIKTMTEGARYLKDTVKKIVNEEPEAEEILEEAAEEAAEAPAEEPVVTQEVCSAQIGE